MEGACRASDFDKYGKACLDMAKCQECEVFPVYPCYDERKCASMTHQHNFFMCSSERTYLLLTQADGRLLVHLHERPHRERRARVNHIIRDHRRLDVRAIITITTATTIVVVVLVLMTVIIISITRPLVGTTRWSPRVTTAALSRWRPRPAAAATRTSRTAPIGSSDASASSLHAQSPAMSS